MSYLYSKRKKVRKIVAEEIEIIVTARVEEALREFKKMLPEIKKQMEQVQTEFGKVDLKNIAKNVDFSKVTKQVKEANKEVQKAKKNIKQAFNPNDISGINFQNIKREISGVSTEFQKLKGSNFDLGNMIDLQKYKKKMEEIKPVVQQVGEEISKIGFMKYDTKSIENFMDNYKKEPDGGDISGMKINGVDFEKVNDDLSNIGELKKYQQNLKEIGSEAEKSKNKVQELSNVKFIDYSKIQAKDLLQPQTTTPSNQSVQIAPSQNSMSMWDILKAKIAQVKPYIEQFKNSLQGSGSSKELQLLDYKISEIEEKLQGGVNGEIHLSTKEIVEAEAELERLNNRKEKLENSGDGSNLFAKMASSISRVMPKLNGMSGITIKIKNQIKQMSTGMKQGLGHILKYAGALFSLRSIYSTLSSSASSWLSSQNVGAKQLSSNIEYMKYAMGSVFAPVIQWITGLIYNLMKAIQSVVYALFKVNIFANASAKAYSSMASSAKKAKNETKQLLGVHDEINNIQNNETENGGSSGGAVAPSFDLSGIDSQMSPLAQKLHDFFKPLKESWDKYGPALVAQIKTTASQVGYLLSSVWGSFEKIITNGTVYTTLQLIFAIIGNIAEAFANAWNYHGNGDIIVQNMANALNNLLTAINNFVTSDKFQEWLNKCSDKLAKMSEKIAEIDWQPVVNAIGDIGMAIGTLALEVIDKLIDAFKWLTEHPDVATILIAIGVALAVVGTVISIVSTVMAVLTPIATALNIAMLPLIATIVGIVAIIVVLIVMFVEIKKNIEILKENWDILWPAMKEKIINVFNEIKEKAKEFKDKLVEKFTEIKDAIVNKVTEVKDKAIEKFENIKSTVSEKVNNLKTNLSNALNNIKSIWEKITNGLNTTVSNVWNRYFNNYQRSY